MPAECGGDKEKMLKSLLTRLEGDFSIQAEVGAVLCEGQVVFEFLKVTSYSMTPFQPVIPIA